MPYIKLISYFSLFCHGLSDKDKRMRADMRSERIELLPGQYFELLPAPVFGYVRKQTSYVSVNPIANYVIKLQSSS